MHKYVGRVVTIVYQDRKGNITKRQIRVISVENGMIRGFCFRSGASRLFSLDRILAIQPVVNAS